jgi:hypothetical protein
MSWNSWRVRPNCNDSDEVKDFVLIFIAVKSLDNRRISSLGFFFDSLGNPRLCTCVKGRGGHSFRCGRESYLLAGSGVLGHHCEQMLHHTGRACTKTEATIVENVHGNLDK